MIRPLYMYLYVNCKFYNLHRRILAARKMIFQLNYRPRNLNLIFTGRLECQNIFTGQNSKRNWGRAKRGHFETVLGLRCHAVLHTYEQCSNNFCSMSSCTITLPVTTPKLKSMLFWNIFFTPLFFSGALCSKKFSKNLNFNLLVKQCNFPKLHFSPDFRAQ